MTTERTATVPELAARYGVHQSYLYGWLRGRSDIRAESDRRPARYRLTEVDAAWARRGVDGGAGTDTVPDGMATAQMLAAQLGRHVSGVHAHIRAHPEMFQPAGYVQSESGPTAAYYHQERALAWLRADRQRDLPDDLAVRLRDLHGERGPEFASALRAARDAGWTLAAIGRALDVTPQAVHYHVQRATQDASEARERWTCPGPHCGRYQGYKYGCRKEPCNATVAPYSAARREAAGAQPRTPIDEAILQQVLTAVRGGTSLTAACETAGISPHRLGGVRRSHPEYDAALVQAAQEGGLTPPLRPVRQLRCPGDCGARGYALGCREDTCTQAHSAAIQGAPSRQYAAPARRFGAEDREAVLALLRAGRTIIDAVAATGWSYDALSNARKTDPAFDAAVIDAREAGRPRNAPGDRPRPVSRVDTRR